MNDQDPLGTGPASATSRTTGPTEDAKAEEFRCFYRGFVAHLVGFLVWQGAPTAIAADIAQETMFDAYRSWVVIEHPQAWARRVASRKLVRHISQAEEEPVNAIPEVGALVRSPDALAEWESRQELQGLLNALPARQRQVLAWSVAGHTPAQIAEELGIEPATVRASLMKARRAAAQFLAAGKEDA